ncbi:hypothetical protein MMC19_002881 [Ptychographa xylographoides]|nr:hypothetical protein [Ptychographa xylographoides]
MHLLSKVALGLAAAPLAFAGPIDVRAADAKTTTVTQTVTETKIIKIHTVTDTVTDTITKTKKTTITGSCPIVSVGSTTTTSSSSSAGSTGTTTAAPITTTTTTSAVNTNPTSTLLASDTQAGHGLNAYAKATGKVYLGTAADVPGPEQQDAGYMAVLNNVAEFGQLTPANYMKYEYTEPSQNVFNYTGGDVILDIGEANGQIVRCHNLVWYNQLPYWLTNPATPWTNATLIAVMENHITNLVSHWNTRCYAWDVVNEALNDDGTYRADIWYNTIGPAYLAIAFAAAAKAAPASVKLYYNDYNIEYPGPKATAAQQIIASIKAQGIRIDGAGLQSHFIIGETPSTASQMQNMASFAALGVDVAITELDVRSPTLPPTVAQQAQQEVDFYSSVLACVNTAACVGVTLWDWDDTYSWIPSTFAGQGYGDPWFQPNGPGTPAVKKIAYDGIVDALTGKTVGQ